MPFDFETLPDRRGTAFSKWATMTQEEQDRGLVPLSVADMELLVPPCAVDALVQAAQFGNYGYTKADDAYLSALAGFQYRKYGFSLDYPWVVPVSGVVPAVAAAVLAFTKPGEGILTQTPGYPPLRNVPANNGRVSVVSPLLCEPNGRYSMDFDDLTAKLADPHVTMMLLCNPHNPVGRAWTAEEIAHVASLCQANNVRLVSDEIHADLTLTDAHIPLFVAAPFVKDTGVILSAVSKTFGLAGLQLANAFIPGEATRKAFQAQLTAMGYGSMSYCGHRATIAVCNEGEAWLTAFLQHVRENIFCLKEWLGEHLPQLVFYEPEATYLAWLDFRPLGLSVEELSAFLRGEAGWILSEGPMFGDGGAGYMRLNLAVPTWVLQDALKRLEAALVGKTFA